MRKVLAALIILLIGSVYVLSIKQDDKGIDTHMTKESPQDTKRLEELEEMVSTNYPNTPKEVMELHNMIMAQQYTDHVDEVMLEELVQLMRVLYDGELIQLNTYESQLEMLIDEIESNKEQEIFLENSNIETIEFVDQQLTVIEVEHHMTQKTIARTYYLVKEEDKWKIHSWKDELLATE